MLLKTTKNFKSIFSKIDDPRSDINKFHRLEDILLIGIISVICAADTWKDMETCAKAKEDFLRSFLDLPNNIPSDVIPLILMVKLCEVLNPTVKNPLFIW